MPCQAVWPLYCRRQGIGDGPGISHALVLAASSNRDQRCTLHNCLRGVAPIPVTYTLLMFCYRQDSSHAHTSASKMTFILDKRQCTAGSRKQLHLQAGPQGQLNSHGPLTMEVGAGGPESSYESYICKKTCLKRILTKVLKCSRKISGWQNINKVQI